MTKSNIYDEAFYLGQQEGSYISANVILSLLFNYHRPKTVVDVGCGVGTWLKACLEKDVAGVKGYDINQLSDDKFLIDRDLIEVIDLESGSVGGERYDLALSLEVGEHIDPDKAEKYVDLLVSLSDTVLFSAANPSQIGIGHVNEQPPQYWADLFKKRGYSCFDFLRFEIMNDARVSWWYRQNVILFVHKDKLSSFTEQGLKPVDSPAFIYHPERFLMLQKEFLSLKDKRLSRRLKKIMKHLFGRG